MKSIKGYEKRYQIYEDGSVWSILTKRFLKPYPTSSGYLYVNLTDSLGSSKKRYIHRLVAEAYVDNLLNKPQVNHEDGDKLNNKSNNLTWVTAKENSQHAWKNNLCEDTRLSKTKVTLEQAIDIQDWYNNKGMTQGDLSALYKIGIRTINNILKYRGRFSSLEENMNHLND